MYWPDVTPIALELIKKITDNFSKKNLVGQGGYGEVYKGVLNGGQVAVKKFFPVHGLDDEAFENEFRNLMMLRHKNIVRLIGYCYEIAHHHTEYSGELVLSKVIERVLCFEYMQGGSLVNHISANSCIHDWPTTYKIIKGTCEGLHYLHKGRGDNNYIYHMDLKPGNILLDENKVPKIGDFGLSRLFRGSETHQTRVVKGTLGFMPQEYVYHRNVTPKYDVFSLGVIIFIILVGEERYTDYSESLRRLNVLENTHQKFIETVEEHWKKKMQETMDYTWEETNLLGVTKCIEIAVKCVDSNRDKRPSTGDIVDDLNKLDAQIKEMSMRHPSLLIGQSLPVPTLSGPVGGCARRAPLGVVIVYAFDCTISTPDWDKVGHQVFWLVQEKLTLFLDSYLGYTYVMSTPNTYTSDMKLVDSTEKKANGYKVSSIWRRNTCTENMASGLLEAHKLIRDQGLLSGIILFFSDGLINKGDFFDGAEGFVSEVPVHTFTLGGDAYDNGLRTIAESSPGGTFYPVPVPDKPCLSVPFSRQLDNILAGTATMYDDKNPSPSSEGWPLDVVIVYAFDSTTTTPAWEKVDEVFWLLQKKLNGSVDSALGYTYTMSTTNTYISDMKMASSHLDKNANGKYTVSSAWTKTTCMKNMASGLLEAHKLMSYREHQNAVILLFSDGLINKGDFFDGSEDFISKVPVHTFTLGGDAYNHVMSSEWSYPSPNHYLSITYLINII
ncbi:hypothetical protein ACQ4PT_048071 [Festuca glaucescens]